MAILLLSGVAVLAGGLLMRTTGSITHSGKLQNSANLVEMVFEQYNFFADRDFTSMPEFNSPVTPAVFFERTETDPNEANLGYHGYTIRTDVEYGTNRSTATVTVVVAWKEGGLQKEVRTVRSFTESPGAASGAEVVVQAHYPCDGLTDPIAIAANCPPIPQMHVTAPTAGGSLTSAVTNDHGVATLTEVQPAPDTEFRAGINRFDAYNVEGGRTAFWAIDPNTGEYTLEISTTASIVAGRANRVLITQFRPGRRLSGSLRNSDGGPVDLMQVRLSNDTKVFNGERIVTCGVDDSCTVRSKADGTFHFINIITAEPQVFADGRPGSNPEIQEDALGFVQGYSNSNPHAIREAHWVTDRSNSWIPTINSFRLDLHKLGWMTVRTVQRDSGAAVPGAIVSVPLPMPPFSRPPQTIFRTNSSGVYTLHNVISSNTFVATFVASATVAGDFAYGRERWACTGPCVDRNNEVRIRMDMTYTIEARLRPRTGDLSAVAGLTVVPSLGERLSSGLTDETGAFRIPRFHAEAVVADPTRPFNLWFYASRATPRLRTQLIGRVTDSVTGQPAAQAGIHVLLLPGTTSFYTDSDGRFDSGPLEVGWGKTSDMVRFICDPATRVCRTEGNVPVPIDTSRSSLPLRDLDHGWVFADRMVDINEGGVTSGIEISARLQDHLVAGVVRDSSTGAPLAGIEVYDAFGSGFTRSAADGSYQLWANVRGRTSALGGRVATRVPAFQAVGATTYLGGGGVSDVPRDATPMTPIVIDSQLTGEGLNRG